MALTSRSVGLLAGYAADLAWGDPVRGHPVAGFGRVAAWLERRCYADSRARGAAYALALVAGVVTAGATAERAARRSPVLEAVVVAAATWAVLGGRSLVAEAGAMSALIGADDVPTARRRLAHLCSRDATALGPQELARASLESVAENTSDAVVAPLLWGAVAGVPGLLGYRALNTLDAMVGYRSPRYLKFGWAAARLDDLANWVPARVAAALATGAAPVVEGSPRGAWTVWQRDAGAHPSPNAGPVEGAFAGALGVRLGGSNAYAGDYGAGAAEAVEHRGVLDGGRPATPGDLPRGSRLSLAVGAAAALVAACLPSAQAALRRGGARRG
jgi:adenosylcobinamide-phosphate synthase